MIIHVYIYIHILPIYIIYPSYTSSMDLPFPQALAFQQLLQLPCSKRRLFARVERKRSAEQWAELAKVNQNKQWNKKSKQKAGRRTILGYGLIWINNDGLIMMD